MPDASRPPSGTRIALAYSGSLATSVAIPWLIDAYGADVVTVTVDVGQEESLEAVRDRALAAGAVRAHVLDLRDEFAREYVLRTLKADAGEDNRPLMVAATALVPSLVALKLLDIAEIERATALAHGASGGRPDVPEPNIPEIDRLLHALNPGKPILAPARDWGLTEAQQVDYARRRGVAVPAAYDSAYRVDSTLWGRTVCYRTSVPRTSDASGTHFPAPVPARVHAPAGCPDEPAYASITFARGVPTEINGVAMPLVELIASLGTIARAHGVGRIDRLPNEGAGVCLRESPAAAVLHVAHRALQEIVSTPNANRVSSRIGLQYADAVRGGLWFAPEREALDAYVEKMQERVTGVVRVKVSKGVCQVAGRTSPFALPEYVPATYHAGETFTA